MPIGLEFRNYVQGNPHFQRGVCSRNQVRHHLINHYVNLEHGDGNMNMRDPKLTALLFNECINAQDIEGLVALVTDNHSLICYDNVRYRLYI